MIESTATPVTYLFSDIEGSTRLWESDPALAARTLAWHDELSRTVVGRHRGTIVKMTGDGMHAAFDDPADAMAAAVDLQIALGETAAGHAPISVRCGLHLGVDQRRDNDFFGPAVNRAARIMSAAHGGQILVSRAVSERVAGRLPPEVALRDLGAVRLRDLGSAETLCQIVHPRLRSDFPPLRSMASTPNNLAEQLNSFVGRDREMEQVRQLLANSRLLTLLGMGGLGKSRLSMQVAAIVLDDYPDGVWFVELAALSDPQLVPQAVASVLGVKEAPGATLLEALARFVRDRKLLIVLDNCEHLVQACAELAKRLLQAGPQVRLLASTRDALRIAGETVFQVAPLPPPARDEATLDALLANDAVRLFVDRATAVQPAFRLTAKSAAVVADICRRLDGIPLALELAAARTRSMPIEAIAARLNERFRLLTSSDRTVLPRQQTLRALIDWSYDLLPPDEQRLFQRLSVFAGGWTLDAAESVVAGGPIEAGSVMDLLANLVEKSLVMLDPDSGRYRMLDTVRHYAAERLAQSDEESASRSRHLAWCLAVAERARAGLAGPEQGRWIAELDSERENLLAAHRWCDRAEDGVEQGLQLVFLLKLYWYQHGLLTLGHRVTTEALARTRADDRSLVRCRGLADVGQFCTFMGRYAEARGYLEDSLELARELGDQNRLAAVLQTLGLACRGDGDMPNAERFSAESITVARAVGNQRQLASALNSHAQLLRQQGDLGGAETLYSEAVRILETLGDHESVAIGRLNLAVVAIERRQTDRARALLGQALQVATTLGSQQLGQSTFDILAGQCAAEGRHDAALQMFGAAEAQAERSGLKRDSADAAFLLPLIEESRRALGESAERVLTEGRSLSYADAVRRAGELVSMNP
ncbi:MAG TPA: tetratricopeptide repeat protein [Burkholderiaceae bacterium]|nr:tetratricopeptide repeat protein [Burkholderiaceae bacterium]